jgi:hypothetical protein
MKKGRKEGRETGKEGEGRDRGRKKGRREGDQELVKRSGRDESTWVVTHLHMEAMLGISLYSYPYLN